MEQFTVISEMTPADRKRCILHTFFGRSASGAASTVVVGLFSLFFVILPTVSAVTSLLSGNVSILFLLYLAAAWVYEIKLILKIKNSAAIDTMEYTFSESGIAVKSAYTQSFLPRERITSCEDSRYFYTLFIGQSMAFYIPKRCLTPEDAQHIAAYFPDMKRIPHSIDDDFADESGTAPLWEDTPCTDTEIIKADKDFENGFSMLHALYTLPDLFFMAMIIILLVSFMNNMGLALIIPAVYLIINLLTAKQRGRAYIKAEHSADDTYTIEYHDEFFDIKRNGTQRIYYDSIRKASVIFSVLRIKLNTGSIAMPCSHKLITAIKAKRKEN